MKKRVPLIGIVFAMCFVLCVIAVVAVISIVSKTEKQIHYWEFEYSTTDIKEIKIIKMLGSEISYSVIKEIDLERINECIFDIKALEFKKYGTNLAHPYDLCFLIVFEDGNYDIISKKEPKHYKYTDGKLSAYNSWLKCRDYDQFDELINKYLKE